MSAETTGPLVEKRTDGTWVRKPIPFRLLRDYVNDCIRQSEAEAIKEDPDDLKDEEWLREQSW